MYKTARKRPLTDKFTILTTNVTCESKTSVKGVVELNEHTID